MSNSKVWYIHVEDKTNEDGVKHIATLSTNETPIVGSHVKFCYEGIYEIVEVVYCPSTASVHYDEIGYNDTEVDEVPYCYDKRDFKDRAIYMVAVKLANGKGFFN